MQQVIDSLLPLALLVALGAALLRFGFFDPAFRKGLDRLVYWVALPALIVRVLAEAPPAEVIGSAKGMVIVLCGATVVMAGFSWLVAWAMRLPRASSGVFTQATFRGNLTFVGLPVIALATGGDEVLLAKAALVFAPTGVLYNVLGVGGLVAAQQRADWSLPGRVVKSLVTNPLLLACVAGLAWWRSGAELPGVASTTLALLGEPAGPLALVSLGGAVASYPVGRHFGVAGVAAVLKCAGVPALVWVLSGWLGLSFADRQVAMIFAACPTAVASYVLATQLKADPALAAATIVISTVLSGVSLGVAIGIG